MAEIIEWVKGILGCLLLMSLVLQGMSGKAYIPYLRLFMGILLILTVLSPITDSTGLSDTLERWMDQLVFQEDQKLSDQLIKGDAWLEEQIKEKAEEFAAEASEAKGDELEVDAPEANSSKSAGIKIEVEVERIEPVIPVDKAGGEKEHGQ